MSNFSRIAFQAIDGVTLRGNFYQAQGENRPVIVMTNGPTLLKDQLLQTFINRFVAEGWPCFTYDHRRFGSSDGLPRHEVNFNQQGEDYHDAITAAMSLPGVDPKKVVIWGIGHGAAAAVMAGAYEPRAVAVVSHANFFSGSLDAKTFSACALE
jgi:dipeptidyl aminopeptidase/acylaminoacyl peptidase